MNFFLAILGAVFAGLGVYQTYHVWDNAAHGHLMGVIGYSGPFLIIMGLFRVVRSLAGVPPNVMLRYVFIAIAFAVGWGNEQLIKATYPNAVPSIAVNNQ